MSRFSKLLLLIGISLIFLSFFKLFIINKQNDTITNLNSEFEYWSRKHGYKYGFVTKYYATFIFKINHPSQIKLGESGIISVKVGLKDERVLCLREGFTGIDTVPCFAEDNKSIRGKVNDRFRSGIVGINLALSGVEIKPEEMQLFGIDSIYYWSIQAKEVGTVKGFVYSKWVDNEVGVDYWHGYFDDNRFFEIKINPRNYWTTENILTWLYRFMGSLLTLPGIIAFIKVIKKKKEAKKEKHNLILKP